MHYVRYALICFWEHMNNWTCCINMKGSPNILTDSDNCLIPEVLRIRIRDPVPFWPLDPDTGSGIGFFPDPGSRIPDPKPIFLELSNKFLGKEFYNSLKTDPNFILRHLKNLIIFNFEKFVATKKGLTNNFFSPLSFIAVFGSGIRNG